MPERALGDVGRVRRYLSGQTEADSLPVVEVDRVEVPQTTREQNTTDRFQINFLPDVDSLKRNERRRAGAADSDVLRISRLELDGVVNYFPYRKLQLVYTFEHSLLPVPPWVVGRLFMARSHRFRTAEQWRGGGILAYESQNVGEAAHLARIDSSLKYNALALTVTGSFPQNFLALLTAGVERIIAGLSQAQVAHRVLFCPDPQETGCRHRFDFDALVQSLSRPSEGGAHLIVPCPDCHAEIDFHEALAGFHGDTEVVTREIQRRFEASLDEEDRAHMGVLNMHHQLVALRQRDFLLRFQSAQLNSESEFPRIFLLRLANGRRVADVGASRLMDQHFVLDLFCELPGGWHRFGVTVLLDTASSYLMTWRPYLQELLTILPTLYHTADDHYVLNEYLTEMSHIVDRIPENELLENDPMALSYAQESLHQFFELHSYAWQRHMRKVRTPEGHYLWLDSAHVRAFE